MECLLFVTIIYFTVGVLIKFKGDLSWSSVYSWPKLMYDEIVKDDDIKEM